MNSHVLNENTTECNFTGRCLRFDKFDNDEFEWNNQYSTVSITVEGRYSIPIKMDLGNHCNPTLTISKANFDECK